MPALLGAVGEAPEGQRLLGLLQAESPRLRSAAVMALGRLGHAPARGAMVFALADEVPEVRAAAARALGDLGPPASGETPGLLQPLLSAASDPFPQVRVQALRALVKSGDPGAVPALRERATTSDGLTARTALESLAALKAVDTQVLEQALEHVDPEVLKVALRLLAEQGTAARPALLRALRDPRWDVRMVAAQAAVRALGTGARGPLEEALAGEQDGLVRESFEKALAQLAAPGRAST
jgi:HEAT repeat protein